MKLRTRLLLATSLVVIAAVTAVGYFSSRVIRVELNEIRKRAPRLANPAALVSPLAAHHEKHGRFDGVDPLLRTLRDRMVPEAELLLLDRDFRIVGATSLPAKDARVTPRGADGIEVSYDGARLRFRGNNAAVLSNGEVVASVWVVPPWRTPPRDPVHNANRLLLILVAIVGALSLLAAAILGERIAAPVEHQLAEHERLRRAMVSDVAHELRTPLTNLRATIESIEDGLRSADAATIASLHDDVILLQRLVDDLQTLALAEARQLQLHLVDLDVRSEIERAARPLNGRIVVDAPSGLTMSADRDRFQQILGNLLQNAVRYARSAIAVSAREDDGAIVIAVRDDGEGIAREHLPFVFDRFYRIDASRQRATGGAGLGLAIVKQLVELHGGTVRVESETGRGTTFTVVLPQSGSSIPMSAGRAK